MRSVKSIALLIVLLGLAYGLHAQHVGLVLSGGGARGFAHVGVIKALEENNIPIDYIAGTSMGAVVGAFYAAGYNPAQMERIVITESSRWLSAGSVITEEQTLLRGGYDMVAVSLPIAQRDSKRLLPDYLFSDYEINLGLARYLTAASLTAHNNFDSLFVPFFCMASELYGHKALVLRRGSLPLAVRASMAIPLAFTPVDYDTLGRLFDGGVYNNFPADVLDSIRKPDFIFGVSVGAEPLKRKEYDERNAFTDQLLSQSTDQRTEEKLRPGDVFLRVDLGDMALTDFSTEAAREAMRQGYIQTLAKIEAIKKQLQRRADPKKLALKREAFFYAPLPNVSSVHIAGSDSQQQRFIARMVSHKLKRLNLRDMAGSYYRAKVYGNAKSLFPVILYNKATDAAQITYQIKPAPRFSIGAGLTLYSPLEHQLQLVGRYKGIGRYGYQSEISLMRGSFETSVRARTAGQFYFLGLSNIMGVQAMYMNQNYLQPGTALFNGRPSDVSKFIYDISAFRAVQLRPAGNLGLGYNYHRIDWYYNGLGRLNTDSTQRSQFVGGRLYLLLENSSYNQKQFADRGHFVYVIAGYHHGTETYRPAGSDVSADVANHKWFQAQLRLHKLFVLQQWLVLGASIDAAYSTLEDFSTPRATLLSSPRFTPLSESTYLLQEQLYSKAFAAPGAQLSIRLSKNLFIRGEGYWMQPFIIPPTAALLSSRRASLDIDNGTYALSYGFVYRTLIGPLAIMASHYEDPTVRFRIMVQAGFTLFSRGPWQ